MPNIEKITIYRQRDGWADWWTGSQPVRLDRDRQETSHRPFSSVQTCVGACTDGSNGFRLCDGFSPGVCDPTQGRVEVQNGNEWGTICDDGWDIYSAVAGFNLDVTCRTFGFK